MAISKYIITGFLFVLAISAKGQIGITECYRYDQHVPLYFSIYGGNDTTSLNNLKWLIKENNYAKYVMPLDLKYNYLPDSCNCYISLKPMLIKPDSVFRSIDSCIFIFKTKSIIIKTQEIDFENLHPDLHKKWIYTNEKKYLDSIKLDKYNFPYFGYNGNKTARIITKISIKRKDGYEEVIDKKYYNNLLNPNMNYDINLPETMVEAYQTPDKILTYIYIIGLNPYKDFTQPEQLKSPQIRSYYTKIIYDNSPFGTKESHMKCATTIPPYKLFWYQFWGEGFPFMGY